jgi:sugar diacid utilization regulator
VTSQLQLLIDYLGNKLGRSVAIDDARIRLLAYNAHSAEVDRARMASIMQRSVPAELSDCVRAAGAEEATDIFRVPACPAIGLAVERIGMPIRYEDSLLGYIWLLASDGPVSEDDGAAIREAAARAALVMHREYLAGAVGRSRERELLRDLVSPDTTLRAEAADALVEEDLIVAGHMSVLVATVTHEPGELLSDDARLALQSATDYGRRRRPPQHALSLNRPDHSLLVCVWPGSQAAAVDKATSELGRVVHERLTAERGQKSAGSAWIGIGRARRLLTEASQSYTEARRAADVAMITGALGPVVAYARLGVYALLAKLPPGELMEGIHPGIRPLLSPTSSHADLISTLQAYFDNAGHVQRTAAQLHVHRATLYYRLRQFEDLASLDLSRGDDRLAAHLSLKLGRLIKLE